VKIDSATKKFHRDESGAIAIFLMAAAMILTMMTFVIYDTGMVARDKMQVQAAADTAAVSQASIKARSMNMLAYSNVAKRSIFAANSSYLANLIAYAEWTTFMYGIANSLQGIDTNLGSMAQGSSVAWRNEISWDFSDYSGRHTQLIDFLKGESCGGGDCNMWTLKPPTGDFVANLVSSIIQAFIDFVVNGESLADVVEGFMADLTDELRNDWTVDMKDLISGDRAPNEWGGLSKSRFGQDMEAIDNYQRYISAITPWWGWTEQLVKGIRNGATTAGSAPQPKVLQLPSTSEMGRAISGSMGGMRIRLDNTRLRDTLPVRPGVGPLSERDPDTSDWGDNTWTSSSSEPKLNRGHPDHIDRNYMMGVLRDDLPENDLGVSDIIDLVSNIIGGRSGANAVSGSDIVDPENPGSSNIIGSLFTSDVDAWVMLENFVNALNASFPEDWGGRASYGSASNALFQGLMTFLTTFRTFNLLNESDKSDRVGALEAAQKIFTANIGASATNPWTVRHYRYESDWLAQTSNIVLTYSRDERNRFSTGDEGQRRKYGIVKGEKKFGGGDMGWVGGAVGQTIYGVTGYWGMARSEIIFNNADLSATSVLGQNRNMTPNIWQPSWTAKLRPVTYPDEFREGEYRMSSIYHDILPSMAMTSALDIRSMGDVGDSAKDFFQMERNARAMGWTTMNGVPK
jgi:hypothetical protein